MGITREDKVLDHRDDLYAGYVTCASPGSVVMWKSRVLCHLPFWSGTQYAWDCQTTFESRVRQEDNMLGHLTRFGRPICSLT